MTPHRDDPRPMTPHPMTPSARLTYLTFVTVALGLFAGLRGGALRRTRRS